MGDFDNYIEANKNLWDKLARIHHKSEFYDVAGFLKGGQTLDPVELEELPDLSGKKILHLQCHFGMDTLSLARLGAEITGVDFSPEAIELARELAEQHLNSPQEERHSERAPYYYDGAHCRSCGKLLDVCICK